MALRYTWLAGSVGPFVHEDDGTVQVNDPDLLYNGAAAPDQAGFISSGQIEVGLVPTIDPNVLRLVDVGVIVGDVVGPGAGNSTDEAVVRWDTNTGKLLQDSGVLINDTNDMTLPGNLTFTGPGDGLSYGSLYLHEGAVTIDINAVGQGVYVKITGLTAGLLNNVTENSDAFNCANIGVYKVDWSISGDSDGINKDYHCDIFLNGVEQGDGSSRRVWGGAHALSGMSGTAILDITNAAHDIDLRIKEEGGAGGTSLDLYHVNFNIIQIGGT